MMQTGFLGWYERFEKLNKSVFLIISAWCVMRIDIKAFYDK